MFDGFCLDMIDLDAAEKKPQKLRSSLGFTGCFDWFSSIMFYTFGSRMEGTHQLWPSRAKELMQITRATRVTHVLCSSLLPVSFQSQGNNEHVGA